MSRAFTKEDDSVEELPDRPVSDYPNDVTKAGLAQIEAKVDELSAAYAKAQADGDRDAMAGLARDLRYWSARRASAHLVPCPTDTTAVRFGSRVTIFRDDGREQTFTIVGEDEAEPAKGTLSHASPLARALLGKSVGDTVPAGQDDAEIVRIAIPQ
ncbi:MAG: transcription elongation factor GreA [Bradyrhizobiaceae bacterium]|nr:MAG: transcription elongation factor GreA [Bradyrhizobiaceae bacterium]